MRSQPHQMLFFVGVVLQKGQLLEGRPTKSAREWSQVLGLVQMVKVVVKSLGEKHCG